VVPDYVKVRLDDLLDESFRCRPCCGCQPLNGCCLHDDRLNCVMMNDVLLMNGGFRRLNLLLA
jgi:hypothetical protein